MKHIKLFESFDSNNDVLYFYIEDGNKQSIVSLRKEGGKWREYVERGNAPYGFGGKTYQSYLTASDINYWLSKDYSYVEQIDDDSFDDYLPEDKVKESITESKLTDGEAEESKKTNATGNIHKDFSVDGKYIFDTKLSDDEQEKLLMAKLDQIIKKKKLNQQDADKVRDKWKEGIKKHGVKKFGSELESRYKKYDGGLVSNRVAALGKKIKGEVMKGYKQPLMQMFDDVYDILAGNIY